MKVIYQFLKHYNEDILGIHCTQMYKISYQLMRLVNSFNDGCHYFENKCLTFVIQLEEANKRFLVL